MREGNTTQSITWRCCSNWIALPIRHADNMQFRLRERATARSPLVRAGRAVRELVSTYRYCSKRGSCRCCPGHRDELFFSHARFLQSISLVRKCSTIEISLEG